MSDVELLRPSAANAWVRCAASATLTVGMESTSGGAARLGTAIHALAYAKKHGQPVGDHWIVDGVKIPLTEEAHDMADMYLRFLELAEMDVDTSTMEAQVDLAWYFDPLPMPVRVAGSADWWGYNFETGELHVADLKTGIQPVSPKSYQLMIYALCAIGELDGAVPKTIRLTIVQPRYEMVPIKSVEISITELMLFGSMVRAAIQAVADGDTTETPGEKQCQWCLRAGDCRARASNALAALDDDWRTSGFTDSELGAILDRLDEAEAWIKAVRTEASRRLETGAQITGWKLVERMSNRKWSDADAAAEKFQSIMGADAFAPAVLLSPAQMEKALKKFGGDPKMVAPFVTREVTGVSLARQDDARSKVSSGALDLLSSQN